MNPQKRGKLEEQLSAYLDGELSADQRAEVEAFLAEDEQARRLLDDLRRTVQLVQTLPRAKAGDELIDALRGRLERKALLGEPATPAVTRRRPIHSYAARWAAVAAVLALSLTTLYLIWPREPNGWPRQPGHQQIAMRDEPVAAPAQPGIEDARPKAFEAFEAPARGRIVKVTEDAQPRTSAMPVEEADSSAMASVDGDSSRAIEHKISPQSAAPETMLTVPTRKEGVVIELAYADRSSLDRAASELSTKYGFQSGKGEVPRPDTEKVRLAEPSTESLDHMGQMAEAPVTILSVDLPDRAALNEIVEGIQHARNQTGGPRDIRIEDKSVPSDTASIWPETMVSMDSATIKETDLGWPPAEEKPKKPSVVDEQQMRRGIGAFLSRLKTSLAEYGFVETMTEANAVVIDTQPVSQPTEPSMPDRELSSSPSQPAIADIGEELPDRSARRSPGPMANQPVDLLAPSAPAATAATAPATAPTEPTHILRLYLRIPASQTRPEESP